MPVPATLGSFKTDLYSMAIGDYIACRYDALSGQAGTFSELGASLAAAQANEISVSGSDVPGGYFYLLKSDPGILLADRNVQHSVLWSTLNAARYAEGRVISFSPVTYTPTAGLGVYSGYPLSNMQDSSSGTQTLLDGASSLTQESYTADQRSFTLALSRQVRNCRMYLNVAYGLNSFEIHTSTDGTNFTYYDTYYIKANSTINLYINKTMTHIKIKDMRSFYSSSANLGLNDVTITAEPVKVRMPTCGIKELDHSNLPLGAFPSTNEWDTYITKSTLGGKIKACDTNVWHHSSTAWTYGQETPSSTWYDDATCRVMRYYNNEADPCHINYDGDKVRTYLGFRPLFEFVEPASETIGLYY